MGDIKDWVPLFSQLVWPVFILTIAFLFKQQCIAVFTQISKAIGDGRSVSVGDWFHIGEKTSMSELGQKAFGDQQNAVDMSVESVGGYESFIEKGSYAFLNNLRERLLADPNYRIDVMVIKSSKRYSSKLLSSYISMLGIRFILFEKETIFDGWVNAGVFVSQLPPEDSVLTYSSLREGTLGVSLYQVASSENAIETLKFMSKTKSDSVAVLEDLKFKFMVDRGTIVSRILIESISFSERKSCENVS